ncbi:hypothetical protein IV203_032910 [Nitzschia inconspicua]|uniref:Uncharacterized protein n=1 Tax=Nitzschia inconspicua TaxID=303405 RepID=A0A9K3KKF0_9STRA|nr:hypothetical protein IV203_032910 [Nitzschia inconspicua]
MQGFTSNIPLVCYWNQYHDQSFYITSTDIETAMRDTASEYYELDSVKHKDISYKIFGTLTLCRGLYYPAGHGIRIPSNSTNASLEVRNLAHV